MLCRPTFSARPNCTSKGCSVVSATSRVLDTATTTYYWTPYLHCSIRSNLLVNAESMLIVQRNEKMWRSEDCQPASSEITALLLMECLPLRRSRWNLGTCGRRLSASQCFTPPTSQLFWVDAFEFTRFRDEISAVVKLFVPFFQTCPHP